MTNEQPTNQPIEPSASLLVENWLKANFCKMQDTWGKWLRLVAGCIFLWLAVLDLMWFESSSQLFPDPNEDEQLALIWYLVEIQLWSDSTCLQLIDQTTSISTKMSASGQKLGNQSRKGNPQWSEGNIYTKKWSEGNIDTKKWLEAWKKATSTCTPVSSV